MQRNGINNATDGSERNDMLTKAAVEFMKAEVKDPELREILEPKSKCHSFHSASGEGFVDCLSTRSVQTSTLPGSPILQPDQAQL